MSKTMTCVRGPLDGLRVCVRDGARLYERFILETQTRVAYRVAEGDRLVFVSEKPIWA